MATEPNETTEDLQEIGSEDVAGGIPDMPVLTTESLEPAAEGPSDPPVYEEPGDATPSGETKGSSTEAADARAPEGETAEATPLELDAVTLASASALGIPADRAAEFATQADLTSYMADLARQKQAAAAARYVPPAPAAAQPAVAPAPVPAPVEVEVPRFELPEDVDPDLAKMLRARDAFFAKENEELKAAMRPVTAQLETLRKAKLEQSKRESLALADEVDTAILALDDEATFGIGPFRELAPHSQAIIKRTKMIQHILLNRQGNPTATMKDLADEAHRAKFPEVHEHQQKAKRSEAKRKRQNQASIPPRAKNVPPATQAEKELQDAIAISRERGVPDEMIMGL